MVQVKERAAMLEGSFRSGFARDGPLWIAKAEAADEFVHVIRGGGHEGQRDDIAFFHCHER